MYNSKIVKELVLVWMAVAPLLMHAQETVSLKSPFYKTYLKNLDLAVSLGSTGVGVDVATRINPMFQLRAGVSYMPRFEYTMDFGIEGYNDDNMVITNKFNTMAETLTKLSGYEVDSRIDVIGKPNYYNFNLLLDIFPFRSKKWYLTCGFYWGNSKIAKAYNTTEDMPTLMAVGIYNHLYDYLKSDAFMDEPLYNDIYLDPVVGNQLKENMTDIGRMGIHLGNKKDGKPYMMEADKNGMVKTQVNVNSFKPYIGFGYTSEITPNGNYNLSFDCGMMFWGGTPKVYTHDGVDLVHDVSNIGGKVGDYVDIIETFKVFPVVSVRISRRLF